MWTLPLSGGDIKQNRRRQWHSPHPPRGQAPGKNWHLYGCWGQGDFATGIGWRRRHYGFNGDTPKWTVGVFLDRIELGAHVRIATVQALIFRWTKTANHGKLILGDAGQ